MCNRLHTDAGSERLPSGVSRIDVVLGLVKVSIVLVKRYKKNKSEQVSGTLTGTCQILHFSVPRSSLA